MITFHIFGKSERAKEQERREKQLLTLHNAVDRSANRAIEKHVEVQEILSDPQKVDILLHEAIGMPILNGASK